jgi:hypothetical protein
LEIERHNKSKNMSMHDDHENTCNEEMSQDENNANSDHSNHNIQCGDTSSKSQSHTQQTHGNDTMELFEREEHIFQELEKQKQQEQIENEKRLQRLEMMDAERQKQQEKLKFEQRLSEICEDLNNLKDKFNSISVDNVSDEYNALNSIDVYNHELLKITDEIRCLCNQPMTKNAFSNANSSSDYYLCNTLDQVTLTQFDLIKNFIVNLSAQVETKKNELLRKQITKSQLNECEDHVLKLIDLAMKYLANVSPTPGGGALTSHVYCENVMEIEDRIQSIDSIETSIRNYLRQIGELNKSLSALNSVQFDQVRLEAEILQPLSAYSASLKTYVMDLKSFENEMSEFRLFLTQKLKFEDLVKARSKETSPIDFYETAIDNENARFNLNDEYEKYFYLRDCLQKKLADSCDLLLRGAQLYDCSKQRIGVVVGSSKLFYEQRDLVNDISKYLDEKCALLNYVLKEQKKLDLINFSVGQAKTELNQLEAEFACEVQDTQPKIFKHKLEKLADLRRKMRDMAEDKEKSCLNSVELKEFTNELKEHENALLYTRLEAFAKKFNAGIRNSLDEAICKIMEEISSLEVLFFFTTLK